MLSLDAADGDVAEQLRRRFDPRGSALDVRQAPLHARVPRARCGRRERWLLLLLSHHLIVDHTTLEIVLEEARAHLLGEAAAARAAPFRNFVAQARLGVGREEHEAFFRAMLGDVDEPTAPFGLLDVRGDGSGVEEARHRARCRPGAAAARAGASARGERGEPVPSGLRASAGARLGTRRRGVRHGAVRPHAWRRGRRPGARASSSTRCRCAFVSATRAWRRPCGARIGCSPICCATNMPRWRWRSAAAASPRPRRCSRRCSTIGTARLAKRAPRTGAAPGKGSSGFIARGAHQLSARPCRSTIWARASMLTAQTQAPLGGGAHLRLYARRAGGARRGAGAGAADAAARPRHSAAGGAPSAAGRMERHGDATIRRTAASTSCSRRRRRERRRRSRWCSRSAALLWRAERAGQSAGASSARAGRRAGDDGRRLRRALLRDDRRVARRAEGRRRLSAASIPIIRESASLSCSPTRAGADPHAGASAPAPAARRSTTLRLDADWPTIARRERGESRAARDSAEPRLCHLYIRLDRKAEGRRRHASEMCVGCFVTTQRQYRFAADDRRGLAFHSFAFDFSVWEIWGAAALWRRAGRRPPTGSRARSEAFYELLRRNR